MSNNRVYNFNPGPSTLPLEVLEEVKSGFMNFGGMSIFELSHRSSEFGKIMDEARALMTELMEIPKGYHVLFLQGGASGQFAMVPMNLMDKEADYSITGVWSRKALKEASLIGRGNVVFSSEETKFNRAPRADDIKLNREASYLHITTNNTIYGTQYKELPATGDIPLVADMSSDIMSYRTDVSKFGLIYAGAQKNLGPAGVTIVIIRDDLAKRNYRAVPTTLKYSTHVESGSLFNTPPVFGIYVIWLVLKLLKKRGGIAQIEKRNIEKAKMIYDVIDTSDFYKGVADIDSRSNMNVVFNLPSVELETKFVEKAKAAGMIGLKGHRLLGGIRASIYNAFPVEGAKRLVEFMNEFEKKA